MTQYVGASMNIIWLPMRSNRPKMRGARRVLYFSERDASGGVAGGVMSMSRELGLTGQTYYETTRLKMISVREGRGSAAEATHECEEQPSRQIRDTAVSKLFKLERHDGDDE
jgi:hypothetical protein